MVDESDVAVVLPALNEAEALAWILPRFPAGYTPIVVDNGSTDGTAMVAEGLGARVVHESVRGFGAACWAGLQASEGYEIVAFMDADGSLDPLELPRVCEPVQSGEADLVLGRRKGTTMWAFPPQAQAANAYLSHTMRRRFQLDVHGIGPMRSIRRDALLSLGIQDRRFGWPLEMITRAAQAGWRVLEVEVSYGPRRGGKSKVAGSVKGTVRAVRDMHRVLAGSGSP